MLRRAQNGHGGSGRGFGLAVMLAAMALIWTSPTAYGDIPWRSGSADIASADPSQLGVTLDKLAGPTESRHIVVQFERPVTDGDRLRMQKAGLTLLSYVGNNAYFASLSGAKRDTPALTGMPLLRGAAKVEQD